ncbi:MAG TPA: hypothetical protein VF944_01765 [Candidatus Bathyarchaeia archaeon]
MSHSKVGIVGYGVYIPRERIETAKIVREREKKRGKELEKVLEKVRHGLLLREKAVAGHTEDTMTIATEAAENAIRMAGISLEKSGASPLVQSLSRMQSGRLRDTSHRSLASERTYSLLTLKALAILECRASVS